MITNLKEPIELDWTLCDADAVAEPSCSLATDSKATARAVNHHLASIEVSDIEADLVPYLAAAAAELALVAGLPWRFSADDAPVALLRLIAKVAMRHPDVGGPHTRRLLDQLRGPATP